ncbi:hypothetical protein ACQR2D_15520 [Bradyrhizobium sp. HKCCYLRH2057]
MKMIPFLPRGFVRKPAPVCEGAVSITVYVDASNLRIPDDVRRVISEYTKRMDARVKPGHDELGRVLR